VFCYCVGEQDDSVIVGFRKWLWDMVEADGCGIAENVLRGCFWHGFV
jgi:hypothetical protein